MSARQFRDKLVQIGYPNAKELPLTTFEYLVENEQLTPFFEFINQIDENNILSEDEFKRYEQLKISGTEIQELAALEINQMKHQQPLNELEREVSQLSEELDNLKHEAMRLELLNQHLSQSGAVKVQRIDDGCKVANDAEKTYNDVLKECVTANENFNTVLKDVQEKLNSINATTKLKQENTTLSPFLAFMPLDEFQKGYNEYSSYLKEYIDKQFPSEILSIAELGCESRYELINLKKLPCPTECMPKDKLILYKLLKSNYDNLFKVESQMVTASCTESGLKEQIKKGERLLDSLEKGICPFESILSIKLSENKAELANWKSAALKIEGTTIPKLVTSLAEVNASSVITGNYTLKWERQKYVLDKMDKLISWLVEHQSQAEFFSWCLSSERGIFKQIQQFLQTLDSMTQEQLDGVEKRMLAMEKLFSSILKRENTAKNCEEVLKALDKILYSGDNTNQKSILSKDKQLLIKLKEMKKNLAIGEEEAEANFYEEIAKFRQIHSSLNSLEDLIWAECPTKSGPPLLGPKEVYESIQNFQTKLENLNYEFLAAKVTFEKKEKALESNARLKGLRTCYLDFYNKKCNWESSQYIQIIAKMAPYPEELDVFSIPHSRMKQLVEGYSNKVSCTDFSNSDATESLLHSLYSTFREFKSHETIENEFIMQQLKCRLRDLEVREHETMVCNCHSDNRLSEMLRLVCDGYSYNKKSPLERISYGRRLEAALEDFTKTFLPHMEEEEEIFQPMLVKYFDYEELKSLKELVIDEHRKLKDLEEDEKDEEKEKFCLEDFHSDSEKKTECIPKKKCAFESPFELLPLEITEKIFSFLRPPDLANCSSVCRTWYSVSRQPTLWRNLLPTQWARGNWDFFEDDYFPSDDDPGDPLFPSCHACSREDYSPCRGRQCYGCHIPDEDADIDESQSSDSDDSENFECNFPLEKRERRILEGLTTHLLPFVGLGVRCVSFAGCCSLDSQWLLSFLQTCPNLVSLDLSYSNIDDEIILRMLSIVLNGKQSGESTLCTHLNRLDLSGCGSITDSGLINLIRCLLLPSTASNEATDCPLHSLKLSGCSRLTDESLRFLSCHTTSLRHVDLSGCWMLTGSSLRSFVLTCPQLLPERLSYCDHIVDGPYQDSANGCQNLGSRTRSCCCSSGE